MKISSLPFLLCLCALSGSVAHSEPFSETSDPYNAYRTHFLPPLKRLSPPSGNLLLDDHVLALSKSSDVNLIVDVTRLDPKQRIGAFPASAKAALWHSDLLGLLVDFKEVTRTIELPFDENTFLLWNQVEGKQLAQLIVKSGKDKPAEKRLGERESRAIVAPFVPTLPLATIRTMTNAEFVAFRERGVYKLGQLPPHIQSLIVALSRHKILRPEWNLSRFFDDDFWQSARIRREETGYAFGPFLGPGPFTLPLSSSIPSVNPTLSAGDEKDAPHFVMRVEGFKEPTDPTGNVVTIRPPDPPEPQAGEDVLPAAVYETSEKRGSSWQELNGEDALLTKVSLEAKRQPLRALVASIAKQSGVALKVASTVSADALVTLRVQEMPLSTLMTALARIFNLGWTKSSPKTWTCDDDGRDEIHKLLARSRSQVTFTSFQDDVSPDERRSALTDEVDALFDAPEVDAAQGIAFSSLPAGLQKRVRDDFESRASLAIIANYEEAFLYLQPDSIATLNWSGHSNAIDVSLRPPTLLGGTNVELKPSAEEQQAASKQLFEQLAAEHNPKPKPQPETNEQPETETDAEPMDADDNQ